MDCGDTIICECCSPMKQKMIDLALLPFLNSQQIQLLLQSNFRQFL